MAQPIAGQAEPAGGSVHADFQPQLLSVRSKQRGAVPAGQLRFGRSAIAQVVHGVVVSGAPVPSSSF
jgi:hypothetical protein